MPEPAASPAKPPRTWLPMVAWTLGILAALGLAWSCATVGVAYCQIRKVAQDFPDDVADYVSSTLSRLGGPERAAAKIGIYLRFPRSMTIRRREMTWLLGHCGRPAVPGMLRALHDPDDEIRSYAVMRLGEIGPSGIGSLLIRMLSDESISVRVYAAQALGMIGDPRAVGALTEALKDENAFVRSDAAEALKKILSEGAPK